MTDQAIANRDRIGRLYGFVGRYGTTTGPVASEEAEEGIDIQPEQSETSVVVESQEEDMSTELVFNRFKPTSVAGRILTALAGGPKTPAQLAHLAKSKSAENIMGPGGWFFQLRKFGKTSKKFVLSVNDGRLILEVGKRYENQV